MVRVTNNMMNTQLVRNLNRNAASMQYVQNQISTGKKINKPSDDPVGITYSLRYRSALSSNEQYQKNNDAALSWLEHTDSMLGQAGDILQRVRELTVKGATSTNPQSALNAIKVEIDQLKQQMVDIGNSKLNNKSIFNGQTYDSLPYTVNGASEAITDQGDVSYIVGEGLSIPINISGNEAFGQGGATPEADNVFKILDDLSNALGAGDFSKINDQLALIDSRQEKLLSVRAEVGARVNRVELIEGRLSDLELSLTDLQSKTEDADIAETVMLAKVAENIYQASLSVGSKIIQPSLVDFLR